MSATDRKQKMISLRFSHAEYAILQSKSRIHGAHTISDVARLALHRILHPDVTSVDNVAFRLADLEDRLDHLEAEISLILDRDLAKS